MLDSSTVILVLYKYSFRFEFTMGDKIGEKWKDEGIDCLILDEFLIAPPDNKKNEYKNTTCLEISIESKDGLPSQNKRDEDTKVILLWN